MFNVIWTFKVELLFFLRFVSKVSRLLTSADLHLHLICWSVYHIDKSVESKTLCPSGGLKGSEVWPDQLFYINLTKRFMSVSRTGPTEQRIQFSSPFLFFGGPGMFSRTSSEFLDFSTTTLLSLTAVCILRTLDWLLYGPNNKKRLSESA